MDLRVRRCIVRVRALRTIYWEQVMRLIERRSGVDSRSENEREAVGERDLVSNDDPPSIHRTDTRERTVGAVWAAPESCDARRKGAQLFRRCIWGRSFHLLPRRHSAHRLDRAYCRLKKKTRELASEQALMTVAPDTGT
jgi:hypothetical protein